MDVGTSSVPAEPEVVRGPLADVVDEFLSTVRATVAEYTESGDDRELAALTVDLERLTRATEACNVSVVAAVQQRGLYLADGHRTERCWLRATVRLSDTDIARRIACVRLFRDHPEIRDLVDSGHLGVAQARALAKATRHPRAGQFLPLYLPWLLDIAMNEDFDVFSQQLHEWQQLVDTDGGHRDHTAAHEGRHCNLTTLDDTTYLHAQFGAAQGATIKEIFEHFVDAEYLTDVAEAKARLGIDTETTDVGAVVITVCDRAHEELAPDSEWLHWSIPDPVPVGTKTAFDATVAELRTRIGRVAA